METAKKVDPYDQGLEASMTGKPSTDNPYADRTAAHAEWLEGWSDGEESWQSLCDNEVKAGRPHPDAT